MKIELSTELLPIVQPDTYWNNLWVDINDEYVDEVKQMMMQICGDYIREALEETDFADAKVTMKAFKSPSQYNYGTDWCLFDLEFDDNMIDIIKDKAKNSQDFISWSRKEYRSYDGYISFAPLGDEYFKALDGPLDTLHYKKEYAISMWIMYQLRNYPNKQEEYEMDVREQMSMNGWDVDYEEDYCES